MRSLPSLLSLSTKLVSLPSSLSLCHHIPCLAQSRLPKMHKVNSTKETVDMSKVLK